VLIRARTLCPDCGCDTEVVALALPQAHEWRDDDTPDCWYRASGPAVLFNLSRLGQASSAAIEEHSRGFRPTDAQATALWRNHCAGCNRPLSDDQLHCEPGGAFMPLGPEAARFEMRHVPVAFSGLAGGYAPEPPFYPQLPAA
jgi:hypothetical protein